MIVVMMMVNVLIEGSLRRRRFYRRHPRLIQRRSAEAAESVGPRDHSPAFGTLEPGGRVPRFHGGRVNRFASVAFLESCIGRQRLDGLQGNRHGFLARLGPAQVAIHLGKELVYGRIRQKLIVFAGLLFAGVVRSHTTQILLPNF